MPPPCWFRRSLRARPGWAKRYGTGPPNPAQPIRCRTELAQSPESARWVPEAVHWVPPAAGGWVPESARWVAAGQWVQSGRWVPWMERQVPAVAGQVPESERRVAPVCRTSRRHRRYYCRSNYCPGPDYRRNRRAARLRCIVHRKRAHSRLAAAASAARFVRRVPADMKFEKRTVRTRCAVVRPATSYSVPSWNTAALAAGPRQSHPHLGVNVENIRGTAMTVGCEYRSD